MVAFWPIQMCRIVKERNEILGPPWAGNNLQPWGEKIRSRRHHDKRFETSIRALEKAEKENGGIQISINDRKKQISNAGMPTRRHHATERHCVFVDTARWSFGFSPLTDCDCNVTTRWQDTENIFSPDLPARTHRSDYNFLKGPRWWLMIILSSVRGFPLIHLRNNMARWLGDESSRWGTSQKTQEENKKITNLKRKKGKNNIQLAPHTYTTHWHVGFQRMEELVDLRQPPLNRLIRPIRQRSSSLSGSSSGEKKPVGVDLFDCCCFLLLLLFQDSLLSFNDRKKRRFHSGCQPTWPT